MSADSIGVYDAIRDRRERIVAANGSAVVARVTGVALPAVLSAAQARLSTRRLGRIMSIVCHHTALSLDGLRIGHPSRRHVDARSAVAVLAEEFCPRKSPSQIDDAMWMDAGLTDWFRERHGDRRELYQAYGALFDRCRAELRQERPLK